jgi:hypothetical protein
LTSATQKDDIAMLEVMLGSLGESKYIKEEYLKFDCYADCPADVTLKTIAMFDGRAGLDVLVKAGINNPDDFIQRESLLLLQKITGQRWYDEQSGRRPRRYIQAAEQWWKEHGAEFVAKRREEKK